MCGVHSGPFHIEGSTVVDANAKGKRFEQRLVNALKSAGFSSARRTVRTGYYRSETSNAQDEGDIEGVPGFGVQMKALKTELVPGVVLDRIFGETVTQAGPRRMPLLVNHRVGKGDPLEWWVWLRAEDFVRLVSGVPCFMSSREFLIRTTLGDIIDPMRIHALHRTDR